MAFEFCFGFGYFVFGGGVERKCSRSYELLKSLICSYRYNYRQLDGVIPLKIEIYIETRKVGITLSFIESGKPQEDHGSLITSQN